MNTEVEYLECEKTWVYDLLTIAAGWFGAYTFMQRGGVFCNAQTANVVLFAMALGKEDWKTAVYLLLPISAYFLGAFVSEYLGKSVKRFHFLRWDTVLVGIEVGLVVFLGCLPAKAPDQICQVILNFMCSMQFNTFRQVQGVPAATTFVTNHIRQVGHFLAKYVRHKEQAYAIRLKVHTQLIVCFIIGAVTSTVACRFFSYRAIWGSALLLLLVFIGLVHADRSYEKNLLMKVPHGH
ncbi:Uncharacterized membrane protein YoaK, UPF0700 family [Lachnospiraceae bacterium XBB1006]|nr:Uncharacterized membrane protein YoaK, UPF0700 family [Lachnospiraceae bacterium XBB1006]